MIVYNTVVLADILVTVTVLDSDAVLLYPLWLYATLAYEITGGIREV
jgi:hypothetical protein